MKELLFAMLLIAPFVIVVPTAAASVPIHCLGVPFALPAEGGGHDMYYFDPKVPCICRETNGHFGGQMWGGTATKANGSINRWAPDDCTRF